MLSLQIAAGIVLAALVLKYPKQILRWGLWLALVAVVVVVSIGGLWYAFTHDMYWLVAMVVGLGIAAEARRRRGLSLPKDQRIP